MADQTTSLFREARKEETVAEKLPEGKTPDFRATVDVEEPFTAYKGNRPQMMVVDYFELGDKWNDAIGGYPREVEAISDYLTNKVKSGELADDQKVIKEKLEAMLKVNNLSKEPRASVRIPVLASYVKFLSETEWRRP
jgi:hypothetical protein